MIASPLCPGRPLIQAGGPPLHTTLLALVTELTSWEEGCGRDETRVVETARELVASGNVVLTGAFRGRPLDGELVGS